MESRTPTAPVSHVPPPTTAVSPFHQAVSREHFDPDAYYPIQMVNIWRRYDGGYLPIRQFTQAVMGTGFRGWLSIEVFDGRFEEKYGDDLRRFAKKAMDACERIMIEDNPR
jgi:hypothetical protein